MENHDAKNPNSGDVIPNRREAAARNLLSWRADEQAPRVAGADETRLKGRVAQALNCRRYYKMGWPVLAFIFCKGGYDAADAMVVHAELALHRCCGARHLHFITCSCHGR